jgi:hypothetical protein
MQSKKRAYIILFTIILFVWAIGMAGLILWQTGRKHTHVEETGASNMYQPAVDSSEPSKFGKLLK